MNYTELLARTPQFPVLFLLLWPLLLKDPSLVTPHLFGSFFLRVCVWFLCKQPRLLN